MRNATHVLSLCLSGLLTAGAVEAGVNQGFVPRIEGPLRIEGPQVGQLVRIPIRVDGTVRVKGNVTTVRFDPAYVVFHGFDAGNITAGAIPLSSPAVVREDGLQEVDGGSTLLGAGVTQATTGGVLGTFTFEVIAQVPEGGSPISIVRVEVNTSSNDADVDARTFGPGQFAVNLVPLLPNPIFNVVVERRHDGAVIRWNSRLPGFDDIARIRPRGSTVDFAQHTSPLRQRFGERHFSALRLVRRRGLDLAVTTDNVLVSLFRSELGLPAATTDGEFIELARRVRELDGILRTRSHVIDIRGLSPTVEYDFELLSTSLDDKRSPTFRGFFATRGEPDLRSLFVDQFDVQVGSTGATLSFGTNRPASTSYIVRRVGQVDPVAKDTLNEDGVTRTRITLSGLEPGVEYDASVTVSLVDASALIASGLPAEAATRILNRRFRTHLRARPIHLLRPPVKIVGSDRANIVFESNQPVEALVDYGLVDEGSAKIAQGDTTVDDASLYSWQQESTGTLRQHNITLSNLDPSTLVRYKITLVNSEGDTFTTDPQGNDQWSRDLQFRTAAEGDTLPPEVILGPLVDIRDVLVVVRFATDVPTAATIYVGTDGGTFGTDDEYEFTDLTPDGERRYANRHSVIVSGLEAGQAYRYRLEVVSTAGKTTAYVPGTGGTAKSAGAKQPPGGTGSFTTSNDPDTQFPVVLSGPTVSSKSHMTAIIEWTTDEPADSDVSFGLLELGEETESSAVTTTSHKVTLSNLESGGTYTYRVASTDASGNGATESAAAVFTTDPEVDLTAPRITVAPSVVYKNDEAATIQWTTDEDASGEVAFGTDSTSLGFIRSLPTTDTVHEVALTNLSPSTTYFYRVSSSDLSNNGPTESAVATFATDADADVTLPTISAIETAAADCTAIIAWATDELADSFIEFGTVSGIHDLTVGDSEDVTAHEITLTNLMPGTTYFYSVGSIDRADNGPTLSQESSFTTLSSGDATPPAAPTGFAGAVGSQQVVLSWAANTELDLGGYNIYRRSGTDGAFSGIASRVKALTYTDLGLANDSLYGYQITALDRATPPNESAASTLSLTPTLSAAPSAPTGLDVGGVRLEPTFTFANAQPFTTNATLTYTIQVSTQPDFSDVTASQSGLASGVGTTSWTITRTLEDGATYYWRVRAVEGSLNGPFADGDSFVASAAPLLSGDFDDSGAVDFDDFFLFVDAFGKSAAQFPVYDLNDSGGSTTIDFDDFFLFVDAFGSSSGKPGAAWAFAHRVDETARLRLESTGGRMGVVAVGGDPGLPRDVVRLRVLAEDVEDLGAFGLVLAWDPTVFSFLEAREGPGHLLGIGGGRTGLFRVLDERPGMALIANGLIDGKPVSGSGLLAEVTFRVLDWGRASDAPFELRQAFLASGPGDVRRALAVAGSRLLPEAFALGQAYPNPFNPETHIEFALPADTPAHLVIYDVLGRRVRTLVQAEDGLDAGFYSVSWDGRDGRGRAVASGLYFYRLTTPAFSGTGRMMLIE